MEAWKEELYHHGILGQKWGKRNGPPYPLGSGDHSVSEKKAGWRKSLKGTGHRVLAKVYESNEKFYSKRKSKQSKILAGMNRSAKNEQLKKAEAADKEAAHKREQKAKSISDRRKERANKSGLSDRQKKALKIGAAVVGTAVAAYGTYKLYQVIGNANLERNKKIADKIFKKARLEDAAPKSEINPLTGKRYAYLGQNSEINPLTGKRYAYLGQNSEINPLTGKRYAYLGQNSEINPLTGKPYAYLKKLKR